MIYVLYVVILCKLLCLSNRFIFLIPFPYPYITKHNTTIKPYPHQGVACVLQCRSIIFETQIRLQSISCHCRFQVSTFMMIIIGNIRRRLPCFLQRTSAGSRLLGSWFRILLRIWMFDTCSYTAQMPRLIFADLTPLSNGFARREPVSVSGQSLCNIQLTKQNLAGFFLQKGWFSPVKDDSSNNPREFQYNPGGHKQTLSLSHFQRHTAHLHHDNNNNNNKVFFIINQLDALISQTYFGVKLYMFRRVPLPIIRSLFTVHSAMVCHTGLQRVFEQDQDGTAVSSWSCSKLSSNLYDIYHC